jgi:hypothetical protein
MQLITLHQAQFNSIFITHFPLFVKVYKKIAPPFTLDKINILWYKYSKVEVKEIDMELIFFLVLGGILFLFDGKPSKGGIPYRYRRQFKNMFRR